MNDLLIMILPFIGLLIGIFVTTIGGGGGGLYTPILIMLGMDAQSAVATSLATVLPTTIVGAYNHNKYNHIDKKIGLILGIFGFLGTFIGIYISSIIPSGLLKKAFGLLFLILTVTSIKNFINDRKSDKKIKKHTTVKLEGKNRIFVPLFGMIGGILAGLFGLSGSPPIQLVLLLLGYTATTVIGTTIFVLIFNSIGGILGYSYLGRINIKIVLLLCIGTMIGAFIGPKIIEKIDKNKLEIGIPIIIISLNIIFTISMLF